MIINARFFVISHVQPINEKIFILFTFNIYVIPAFLHLVEL